MQGSILAFIVGFSLLTFSAVRIYQDYAPIPERIVDESGNVLFTRQQIFGQEERFLTYGPMQFGAAFGHGSYLGPEFTTDYMHKVYVIMTNRRVDDEAAREWMKSELQANRCVPQTGILVWTDG